MPASLPIEILSNEGMLAALPALARLRVTVFRAFPYLYEGDLAYEERYLAKFSDLQGGTIVVARDGGEIVGASTALPLAKAGASEQQPFLNAGMDLGRIYYFGESVLMPEYRGRGIGVAFFDAREARARVLGYRTSAFCAVERPADHPRRPKAYTPLDAFWTKRGYRKRPELSTTFSWQDLDEAEESTKPMVFWTKELA
jgi:GNAT superfamily N-acetyltransferase